MPQGEIGGGRYANRDAPERGQIGGLGKQDQSHAECNAQHRAGDPRDRLADRAFHAGTYNEER
ncbi:hypothetical protein D3C81_2215280 [compost metagenome]